MKVDGLEFLSRAVRIKAFDCNRDKGQIKIGTKLISAQITKLEAKKKSISVLCKQNFELLMVIIEPLVGQ